MYIKELVAPLIASTPENVHHIYMSDASNLERLLAHLDKEYQGSIENFLFSCGLSPEETEELRHILLP